MRETNQQKEVKKKITVFLADWELLSFILPFPLLEPEKVNTDCTSSTEINGTGYKKNPNCSNGN